MIAMLPSSSLGNEVTFHFLYHLDACRDCCIDDNSKKIKLWSPVARHCNLRRAESNGLIK